MTISTGNIQSLIRQTKRRIGESNYDFKLIRHEKDYAEHKDGCYVTIQPNDGVSVFNYAYLTLLGLYGSGQLKYGKNVLDTAEFNNLLIDNEIPCYSEMIESKRFIDWELLRKPSYIDVFSIQTEYRDSEEFLDFLVKENQRLTKFIDKLSKSLKYSPTVIKDILQAKGYDKQMSDSIATINGIYKGIKFEITEPVETTLRKKKIQSVFLRVIVEDFFPDIRNKDEYKVGFDNPVYNETIYLMSEKITKLTKELSDKVFVSGVVGYDPEEDAVSKESLCFSLTLEGDYFFNNELLKAIDTVITNIAILVGKADE